MMRATVLHDDGSGGGPADVTSLYHPARGLDTWSECGVGCAAQHQAERFGALYQRLGVGPAGGKWFLVPNVFAGAEGHVGYFCVRCRDGQIDDKFDVVATERRLDIAGASDAVSVGLRASAVRVDVRDEHHGQVGVRRHVGQVLVADRAGPDYGYAYGT